MKKVTIIGATSRIAAETAKALISQQAPEKLDFHLLARNADHLETCAQDLRLSGAADVTTASLDLLSEGIDWDSVLQHPDGSTPDLCLIAAGSMPSQETMESDPALLNRMVTVNLSATASASIAATRLMSSGGTLAVIGSVAGDRGKASNYLYGASKRAVETMLEGLDQQLGHNSPVHIVLLKPGFVESPMTAGMPSGPLMTDASIAGKACAKAISRRTRVAYIPSWWRLILTVICLIPRFVFQRIKL